jgi:hypothetical protein
MSSVFLTLESVLRRENDGERAANSARVRPHSCYCEVTVAALDMGYVGSSQAKTLSNLSLAKPCPLPRGL